MKKTILISLLGILFIQACKTKQETQEAVYPQSNESPRMDAISIPLSICENRECIKCDRGEINYCKMPNTEQYDYVSENEFKSTKQNPLSTFSIDVDKASYANIRRFLNEGQMPPVGAVRVEEMINYFDYKYPQSTVNPFSITTEYGTCPWNKDHQLVLVGLQGKDYKQAEAPPYNLTFLIDVSGSMDEPNKLPLVKESLRLVVEKMREEDCISIVVYAGSSGLVLQPTFGKQKQKIEDALEALDAGGSTAGGEGLKLAYKTAKLNYDKDKINRVILATDGDFNVGISSDDELVRFIEKERESGIYLTVLGFGSGNYKDAKMEKLADKGNGNFAYIDNLLEAKKALVKEMGGTLQTIAKDVKIQVEFNPENIKAYRLVGYENRVLSNEDFNDDTKDAGELGAGHTVTALYELIPSNSNEKVTESDTLKYQNIEISKSVLTKNELMTVKFRYKSPDSNNSILLQQIVHADNLNKTVSNNFEWASTVASFGMLLKNSKFKGNTSYKSLIEFAKKYKSDDNEGYRSEMIQLLEKAELLGN